MQFDAIVIGGGAAGLFCAIEAGKRGRRVLVIEHNAVPGRKILISGGGRCNFTNLHTSPENFVSENPHFCKSALARYTPADFLALVKQHRIEHYEKKLGQMFCRERSQQIVDMLLAECRRARVTVETGCSVIEVAKSNDFTVVSNKGAWSTKSLVVATGGLSFPKIGATDLGYRIASQFGLKIIPTRPSLVPLVFAGKADSRLAGVSIDASVEADGQTFRENILFTHRGLSGPAILQASNYWKSGRSLTIDTLPGTHVTELLKEARSSRKLAANFLSGYFPQRFIESLGSKVPNKPLDQLSNADIEWMGELLNGWQVAFRETEGWHKAEVTLGGVSTKEVSSQTMEAKKIPGLFFIGEVLDVTGWLGGYNFQWAWASAHAAGQAV
jgi:predicted Rossmann fold flavoprotein